MHAGAPIAHVEFDKAPAVHHLWQRLLHQFHQLLVAAHHIIFHFIRGDLGEELLGAVDSGGFDFAEFE